MLDIICGVGVGIVLIYLAALVSFVCHNEANRRTGGCDESH
jgi:hypothetical protein